MLLFFFSFFFFFIGNNMFICISGSSHMNISLDFKMEGDNILFSMVVLIISFMVMLYNKIYFNFKLSYKYKINLNIFIISMILLINSNSMISFMMGWDGLGISSFFLVSFYSNLNSTISSIVTFFFNRLGDSLMMMFFCMYMMKINSLNNMNISLIMLSVLIIGLFTKSSQIPFGVWLPMAMSAPTPISSLVHSSTLVTSGIFLIIKMKYLFFISELMIVMMTFGLITFLLGGMFSISIMDVKKTIAFSTMSQLGFIVISLSTGNYSLSFYHLVFHAFFKSLLFINMGLYMIMNLSTQDSRYINKMYNNSFIKLIMLISIANLLGMYLSCGFVSKDMILMNYFNNLYKYLVIMLIYLGSIFTVIYSLKMLFLFKIKTMSFKINMFKKMNMFNFSMVISCMMLILIPTIFTDMLFMEANIYLANNKKLVMYMLIIVAMLISKLLISVFGKLAFYFSSMIMIMDTINSFMIVFVKKMNKLIKSLIMMEDLIQFMFINKLINLISSNYYINFLKMNLIFLMTILITMTLDIK